MPAAQFEFFIKFDGQLPKNYHRENETSLTPPECLGYRHSQTRDKSGTAAPSGPLPFRSCISAQRLNLMTSLVAVKRPGDRPSPFSDPWLSPLLRTQRLNPCQEKTAALEGTFFYEATSVS